MENKTYCVIHPLDDVPEKKVDINALGEMHLSKSAKISLLALRGYLVFMVFLLAFHVFHLALVH